MTKKILSASALVTLFAAQGALANEPAPVPAPSAKQSFTCYVPVASSDPSYAQLSVVNNAQDTAGVVLTKGGTLMHLNGTYEAFSTRIGSQLVYKLADIYGHEAALTISKSFFVGRGGCGRGSCDEGGGVMKTKKTALLKFGNQQIKFNCTENFRTQNADF